MDSVLANLISWGIETGGALETLRSLPDECIHCIVTSPPYWGLRDYGVAGQIGLETSLEDYLEKLTLIFGEVHRVLRRDGVCWLNMGDKYANVGFYGDKDPKKRMSNVTVERRVPAGLKPKDLVGVPWRLAFAMQEDGWWLRRDIVWSKPNPMPESVTDRPTSAHEYVFLLTKSDRYFYDAEAVKENATCIEKRPSGMERGGQQYRDKVNGKYDKNKNYAGGGTSFIGHRGNYKADGTLIGNGSTRNLRSVWSIATYPYRKAHFATFPPRLPEICIRAGTSQRGACAQCGAPWEREMVQVETGQIQKMPDGWEADRGAHGAIHRKGRENGQTGIPVMEKQTLDWKPTCDCCCKETVPCIVLDPFAGAGTTLMVALRLGRRALGIELNPAYVKLAESRILEDAPLLNAV